jgi:hypothetical protein
MDGWSAIIDAATLILLGVGAVAVGLLRTGTEAAVKTGAEEGAKAALKDMRWPVELAQELQKTRGVERQELRFKSYGALWKKLRELAIYDTTAINNKSVGKLSAKLSDWYFSEAGGLLLTPHARDFYFALQDLLRTTARLPQPWKVEPWVEAEGSQRESLRQALHTRVGDSVTEGALEVLTYIEKGDFASWQQKAADYGTKWREGIKLLAADWERLNNRQRFAVLQQAGSILRTSLTVDLESRLG